jgi:hypothetical protein
MSSSKFLKPIYSDVDLTIRSLEPVFQIYDRIQELRIAGGEVFLHPGIEKILIAAAEYGNRFDALSVITNGSYIPKESILQTMSQLPCKTFVRVDDYGKLSSKRDELISVLKKYNIPVDSRAYNEEGQFLGGWIPLGDDNGGYEHKNYSEAELVNVYKCCKMTDSCTLLWEGVHYNCPWVACGYRLGVISIEKSDVDLLSDHSLDEKRAAILEWGNNPFLACQYCNGYDPENSPRVPAAEQIER